MARLLYTPLEVRLPGAASGGFRAGRVRFTRRPGNLWMTLVPSSSKYRARRIGVVQLVPGLDEGQNTHLVDSFVSWKAGRGRLPINDHGYQDGS